MYLDLHIGDGFICTGTGPLPHRSRLQIAGRNRRPGSWTRGAFVRRDYPARARSVSLRRRENNTRWGILFGDCGCTRQSGEPDNSEPPVAESSPPVSGIGRFPAQTRSAVHSVINLATASSEFMRHNSGLRIIYLALSALICGNTGLTP